MKIGDRSADFGNSIRVRPRRQIAAKPEGELRLDHAHLQACCRKVGAVRQDEATEQAAGQGFGDTNMLLAGGAGGGNLPAKDGLAGIGDHRILDGVTLAQQSWPAISRQRRHTALIQPRLPKNFRRLVDRRRIHTHTRHAMCSRPDDKQCRGGRHWLAEYSGNFTKLGRIPGGPPNSWPPNTQLSRPADFRCLDRRALLQQGVDQAPLIERYTQFFAGHDGQFGVAATEHDAFATDFLSGPL